MLLLLLASVMTLWEWGLSTGLGLLQEESLTFRILVCLSSRALLLGFV